LRYIYILCFLTRKFGFQSGTCRQDKHGPPACGLNFRQYISEKGRLPPFHALTCKKNDKQKAKVTGWRSANNIKCLCNCPLPCAVPNRARSCGISLFFGLPDFFALCIAAPGPPSPPQDLKRSSLITHFPNSTARQTDLAQLETCIESLAIVDFTTRPHFSVGRYCQLLHSSRPCRFELG
jgi:hypothetical protein